MALRYITPTGVEVGAADDFEHWRKRQTAFSGRTFRRVTTRLRNCCVPSSASTRRPWLPADVASTCRRSMAIATTGSWSCIGRSWVRSGTCTCCKIEFFIGPDYVVTLHGPYNPEVEAAAVGRDTAMARDRLDAGRFLPSSPSALAHGILGALSREIRDDIGTIATRVAELERHVIADDLRHPEELLEQMFLIRHELVTVRTMASNAHEIFERMSTVVGTPELDDRALFADLSDRFSRLRTIGDGERDFLAGVIDYTRPAPAPR